ncbi:MAG: formyltetrahydrofolate deformylase [Parachlamydia sp.]|nr:formyltetrahydrofolate deformylase [Parachlamydia sp.]
MSEQILTACLLWHCPDKRGLVAQIAQFLFDRGGNIMDLDVHVDENLFFLRLTWDMSRFSIPADKLEEAFLPLARQHDASYSIRVNQKKRRLAILVSQYGHCLQEILWRHNLREFDVDIPLILSNHEDLRSLAEQYRIPFHLFPITPDNKAQQEELEIKLLKEEQVETIVLARYMQILSPRFVAEYPNRMINIHHSFLPAFVGGSPYRQAYERGVKIVGATCHYVTDKLDEGQIIEQDIIRISHKDSIEDLIRKGRDLERFVLARGIRLHLEDRVLVHGRKTIVFD